MVAMQRLLSWIMITAIMFSVDACPQAQSLSSNAPMPIPITTLQKGNFSGIRQPLQAVVRNRQEWTALWQRHTSIQSPPTPLPAVDFTVEMIAGLFAGEKRSGGYEIDITGAAQIDSTLFIYYEEKTPAPGGMVTSTHWVHCCQGDRASSPAATSG